MIIGGFQKLSLLNFPDKTACTVFVSGCNFRCPWCHNSGLVRGMEPEIDRVSVLRYLSQRSGMLEGVCISGGEPLLDDSVVSFIREIKALGYAVKVDTNGSNPELLEYLIGEGLTDSVAMDIKNTPEKYPCTIGYSLVPLQRIRESVRILKENRVPYEFRTTLIREYHTAEDIAEIGEWIRDGAVWYLQNFQDSPEVPEKGLHPINGEDLKKFGLIGNRYLKTVIRHK